MDKYPDPEVIETVEYIDIVQSGKVQSKWGFLPAPVQRIKDAPKKTVVTNYMDSDDDGFVYITEYEYTWKVRVENPTFEIVFKSKCL